MKVVGCKCAVEVEGVAVGGKRCISDDIKNKIEIEIKGRDLYSTYPQGSVFYSKIVFSRMS
jgi:hypothetical protein